jgi:hypothetical protein
MKTLVSLLLLFTLLSSCEEPSPNVNEAGEDVLEVNMVYVDDVALTYRDTIYIPIYSDIYSENRHVKFNLTATLSIRNTSLQDSIYIEDIDYYDSHGNLVRHYLDNVLLLIPMQSIEYVIEEDDNVGGTGANFMVNWGATHAGVKPIFQGVMISTHEQQSISFITQGVSVTEKE